MLMMFVGHGFLVAIEEKSRGITVLRDRQVNETEGSELA